MKKSKKLMILGLSAATAAVAATGAVSSFAWFATNSTVTASSMKIKADTDQYLEIRRVTTTAESASQGGAWGNAVSSMYTDAKTLKPTVIAASATEVTGSSPTAYSAYSTFTNEASWSGHKWLATSSDSVDTAAKGTSKNYEDVTTKTDVVYYDANYSNNTYALVEEFDIRVRYLGDKTSTYTLNAKATWADTNSKNDTYTDKDGKTWFLHNSARVFFVVGAMSTSGKVATAITDSDKGYVLGQTGNTNASADWDTNGVNIITNLVADNTKDSGGDSLGNGIRVRAYLYFDGSDDDCFSSAVLGSTYSVNYSFSVTKNNA